MQPEPNKDIRSEGFKDLRELHKLYNKHEPALLVNLMGMPELAVCSCGRILKRPATWQHTGANNSEGPWVPWVPINHADKRRLRKDPRFRHYLRVGWHQ
jgi:hypothetical protein